MEQSTSSSTTVDRLRCEYLVNPLGIDESHPRLSWELYASRRGARQVAYQLLISSAADGQGDLWDTGKVESDQTSQIVYDGAPLQSGQRAWWRVRVWDELDQVAESPIAWWEMGLLQDSDWQGQWIGGDVGPEFLRPSPLLRREFAVKDGVQRARISVTARGLYELHLNGQRVGDALLTPGWTDYSVRIQYQTYDVTELLQEGVNAIGAFIGDGWYAGFVGFGAKARHYGARPQLLLQLQISYADGSSDTLVSDGNWRWSTGPIQYSDFLAGESYDARQELEGWATAGFDDTAWESVHAVPRDNTLLVSDPAEPIRQTREIRPISVTRLRRTVQIVDMGQNMVGWVRLRVKGRAGRQVRLRFAEILDRGEIYTRSLRSAKQTDTYILRGGGEEIYEPRFTFHGFRYVEVSGYPGDLLPDDITDCVVGSDTPFTSSFTTSNALVNQLQSNITWGQRGNFLSLPTDCPQRDERLGWLGDAQIFVRTASYNADVAAFFTKWMVDVVDGQGRNGAFPDVAPRLVDMADGAPAWGDAGVIVPWTIWRVYGDTRIIERHWDAMVAWMHYLAEANPDGLWLARRSNDFGDWLSIKADTSKDLLATAYFAYDAALMAQMARAIGRETEAEAYTALFEYIKAAFQRTYVKEDGRLEGDTQTAYVLALHMNLLPEALQQSAVDYLVENIAERGWHLSTGFVGVGYLLPTLTRFGRLDVAYRLLLNETFPSWGYSIRHGATTIWERWDGWTADHGFQTPAMNSFNHYSLGSVGQWLYQSVAGIDVESETAGYSRIRIAPQPGGDLSHAGATYASIHGLISSSWRIADGTLTLEVDIPANTSATVVLPSAHPAQVREGALPASEAEGVSFLSSGDGTVQYQVSSGRYTFVSPIA